MPAGITTISNYLEYIDDAFLGFLVPLYSESIRKTRSNPRKIYTVDPGLSNAYTMSFAKNIGRLFENVVYLELRRKEHEIFYYLTEQRYEVDFYNRTLDGERHLYQVVWDVHDETTFAKETRALKAAEKELGIKEKIITPKIFLTEFILR